MNGQDSLFNTEPYLTDGQRFQRFFAGFVGRNEIPELFPRFYSNPISINLARNVFVSHVLHGGWSEEDFEKSLIAALKSGKKLSTILIERSAVD